MQLKALIIGASYSDIVNKVQHNWTDAQRVVILPERDRQRLLLTHRGDKVVNGPIGDIDWWTMTNLNPDFVLEHYIPDVVVCVSEPIFSLATLREQTREPYVAIKAFDEYIATLISKYRDTCYRAAPKRLDICVSKEAS